MRFITSSWVGFLFLAGTAFAECPPLRGDVAPGELINGPNPPLYIVAGDGDVNVGDVVSILRAAVDLHQLRWDTPGPTCDVLPGDLGPGTLDEGTDPPTWRPEPDGDVNVGDVIAILRASVDLHEFGIGLRECVHEVEVGWSTEAPRTMTDRRCPVGLSSDVTATVIPFDALNEEEFQIDRYTVTYSNISRGGGSEAGVDVPQPIDALLFLDPGSPTYMQSETLSILDEAAKVLPPLNADFFYASGPQTFEATITLYGHPIDRPDATCVGTLTHRFQVFDSGPDTIPEEDMDCIAETNAETP